MRRHSVILLLLLSVLWGCGHSAKDEANALEARRTSAAVASINELCDGLAAISKDAQRRHLFASLSANGEPTPWREYASDDDLESRTQTLGAYVIAEFWQREDGAVLVYTKATSDNGDWNQTVNYCFGSDGALARSEYTLNSFVEDEGFKGVRVRYFAADGRKVFVKSETRDLTTNELRDESEFEEQEPIYKTASALPFAALLAPPRP